MSLLRIYAATADTPGRCQWVLLHKDRDPVKGEGHPEDLPQDADKVHLVVPAQQVLITRTKLPPEARRRVGAVLAFAIEEQILGDPEANQVTWVGRADEADVLAVVDKQLLQRWRSTLEAVGIRSYEIQSEVTLLPRITGEWSMVWQGSEGFVRIGELEGTATDQGDRKTPPQSLRLLLQEAETLGAVPAAIALYTARLGATPDAEAWQRSLGVPIRLAGPWNWRNASLHAGVALAQEQQGWSALSGLAPRLRLPAKILAAALAIHACALVADWGVLTRQQRVLRQGMEAQFRAVFPNAVAIVDPVLQMRRNLAEKRHSLGIADEGDFLSMIDKVASGIRDLPAGQLRVVAYEGGRLTLELSATDAATAQQIASRLQQSGLQAEISPLSPSGSPGGNAASLIIVVRTS